jgi:hypothetical protein
MLLNLSLKEEDSTIDLDHEEFCNYFYRNSCERKRRGGRKARKGRKGRKGREEG